MNRSPFATVDALLHRELLSSTAIRSRNLRVKTRMRPKRLGPISIILNFLIDRLISCIREIFQRSNQESVKRVYTTVAAVSWFVDLGFHQGGPIAASYHTSLPLLKPMVNYLLFLF
jgi:hypothetical protein